MNAEKCRTAIIMAFMNTADKDEKTCAGAHVVRLGIFQVVRGCSSTKRLVGQRFTWNNRG
jgi:ribosome biogenesis protein Tsr3